MIGKEIEKTCQSIYPLQNALVRKVKILKAPKLDVQKLLELHAGATEDKGAKVASSGFKEPPVFESV